MEDTKMKCTGGFTLIELSIVLIVIGFIVGGVLVGQDLIHSAGVRATITQIEKYNRAVNTFRGKYGQLPGDIDGNSAAAFGFAPRGAYPGEGDGNGVIEGLAGGPPTTIQNTGWAEGSGETGMFWVDLSIAGLIDGGFNTASINTVPSTDLTGTLLDLYLPEAKIGGGNYIYVYSVGTGINYYGLSAITLIGASVNGVGWGVAGVPAMAVRDAYSIDTKMDDGLPQSGKVTATYLNANLVSGSWRPAWAASGGVEGAHKNTSPVSASATTIATTGSTTTCYDNSTSMDGQTAANGNVQHYSLEMNNGSGVNCALSFQFQ